MKNIHERIELISDSAKQFKTNLHTHSTESDGYFTPEQLKEIYVSEGYDAVAFTDHRKCVPHTELTDKDFVALTGTELDFGIKDENKNLLRTVHINAISRDPHKTGAYNTLPNSADIINDTLSQLKKDNFYVILNHPVWSGMSTEEMLTIKGYDAAEVFNSISVMFSNYSDDSAFFEYMLRADGRAYPVAADDCHMSVNGEPSIEYGKGFTMVISDELSYSSLIDALDKGSFYASTGPVFKSVWIEGNTLHVECSPSCGVYAHGKHIMCRVERINTSDSITCCDLDITNIRKYSPYIWIQLRDTYGRKAWAAPFWFD